jgi:hypothetical protein
VSLTIREVITVVPESVAAVVIVGAKAIPGILELLDPLLTEVLTTGAPTDFAIIEVVMTGAVPLPAMPIADALMELNFT